VLSGTVDAAVHSMKDIPPNCRWDDFLTIGACLGPRAMASDVLVTNDPSIKSIQSLQNCSKIGSASVRRQAQLKAINPSLQLVNIRGNVDTRLNALINNEVDALVLAKAGLNRLGIVDSETNTIHLPGKNDSNLFIPLYQLKICFQVCAKV
jgi:hydroxymethylbilane synthase